MHNTILYFYCPGYPVSQRSYTRRSNWATVPLGIRYLSGNCFFFSDGMMPWSNLIYISRTRFFPPLEVCSNIANYMNFHARPIWKKPTHLHMVLYHHAKFQKKLMSQFQQVMQTRGPKDRRMEGQTLFYRNLPTTVRFQKKSSEQI